MLLIENPTQYINHEWNAHKSDFSSQDLKVLLAFPDKYEIGMSNLGQRILYYIFNNIDGVSADRVYSPDADLENILRKESIPLSGLESDIPLYDFDIIGFTLQNETSYSNVLNLLDLGKIPVLAQERGKKYPLIIAGGPCVFNPEPMAIFIDAFVIGDGEEVAIEISDLCKNWRNVFADKEEMLKELSKIKGVYVPQFYNAEYFENGTFKSIKTNNAFCPNVVEKRILARLDKKYYPEKYLVPYTSIVHDRAILEISRGCARGCRFCHAGIVSRPVRNRSHEDIVALAKSLINNSGYDELSLASLCAGDFPGIENLVKELITFFDSQKVSVSLPSQRIDNFSIDIAESIQRIRKTGLTFAPEAGTQRLRDVINKGVTDEDLFNTMEGVFKHGWNSIKLYFMIGLPTETQTDIEAIQKLVKDMHQLGRKISKRKININVAISAFIPKPHSPFQWCGQENKESLREKIGYLRRSFYKNIKFQPAEMSFLEAVLARGDRKVGYAVKRAWEKGAKFDSWDNFFRFDLWEQAFLEENLNMEHYANRNISLDLNLPWDHINSGVNKDFLKKEYLKALDGKGSENCHSGSCYACGIESICREIKQSSLSENKVEKYEEKHSEELEKNIDEINNKIILRIKYSKTSILKFVSHLNTTRLWNRVFRRANMPVDFSKGFSPKIIMSFGTILPVGTESISEYLDVEFKEVVDLNEAKAKLVNSLPENISILDLYYLNKESNQPFKKIASALYQIEIPEEYCEIKEIEEKISGLLNKDEIIVEKRTKSGIKKTDIRNGIKNIEILPSKEKMLILLVFVLSLKPGESLRPQEILKLLLDLSEEKSAKIRILRKELYDNEERLFS